MTGGGTAILLFEFGQADAGFVLDCHKASPLHLLQLLSLWHYFPHSESSGNHSSDLSDPHPHKHF